MKKIIFIILLLLLFFSPKNFLIHNQADAVLTCANVGGGCVDNSASGASYCASIGGSTNNSYTCSSDSQKCCFRPCSTFGGSCVLGACPAGSAQATGSSFATCNDNGNYTCCKAKSCSEMGGSCVNGACQSGSSQVQGSNSTTCNPNGLYTCCSSSEGGGVGGECDYCPPPETGYKFSQLLTNQDAQDINNLNSIHSLSPACDKPTGSNTINVCLYDNLTLNLYGRCVTQKTCTTTTANPKCDQMAGCIPGDVPPPSACKINGSDPTSYPIACTADATCNSGANCNNWHCIGGSGYIYDPVVPESATCAYKPDAKPRPNASISVCLTCKSGCAKTDDSGNPYCVDDCTATTPKKVDPTNSQYCDPDKSFKCMQGKGCINTSNAITNGTNPYDTITPTVVCSDSVDSSGNCPSVDSGLGISIPTDSAGFVKTLSAAALSLVGMIAVILIIISGYKMMISQGNPEKLKGAREELIAAVIGLLFVIFAFVFLQTVGGDILKIPGFGG